MDDLPRSFFDLIRVSDRPVLADFWAAWCGPCRMVAPVVARLAREQKGRLRAVKVNVDEKPAVAGRYQVTNIPTLILFWKGNVLVRITGARPYEELLGEIRRHWPADAPALS